MLKNNPFPSSLYSSKIMITLAMVAQNSLLLSQFKFEDGSIA